MSVTTDAEKRKSVRKKKGTATVGADSGLTRKRITRRDVRDRSAAEPMRRRREVRGKQSEVMLSVGTKEL